MNALKELTKIEDQLEALIDKYGLCHVLESMETVCYDKAEHFRCAWQDEIGAKLWEKAANNISAVAYKNRAI